MTAVSVVIRARNEEKWIRHCLDAVLSQTHRNFEVIVVDNSSQDKTVEIAKHESGRRCESPPFLISTFCAFRSTKLTQYAF